MGEFVVAPRYVVIAIGKKITQLPVVFWLVVAYMQLMVGHIPLDQRRPPADGSRVPAAPE
jgi:hypothetical protein